jgi:hypothetical protein
MKLKKKRVYNHEGQEGQEGLDLKKIRLLLHGTSHGVCFMVRWFPRKKKIYHHEGHEGQEKKIPVFSFMELHALHGYTFFFWL